MRYDDRLVTVLNQPAGDHHDGAVRWRQLVDLIARAGPSITSPTVAHAIDEVQRQSTRVDEDVRAATARSVAALPLPLPLLEVFAADKLAVCAPVLAAATLDHQQWRSLLAVAEPETRRFIETLQPGLRPQPPPLQVSEPVEQSAAERPTGAPSLHDVVERIERRRRSREPRPQQAVAGSAAEAGDSALFRWECGPSGEISWVEGAVRGPLVGRSIARPQEGEGDRVDQDVVRAFAVRAPFRDAALRLAGGGPVAGEWKISGVPAFEPADGRFAGYRGVALREIPAVGSEAISPDILADPDSLRELVHEIKTPLNAIIGFAEIIDGQYLGPADRRYRERAAEIVGQARQLLTAIDDLDFAAKIHSAVQSAKPRTNVGELVERLGPSLRELAQTRGAELEVPDPSGSFTAAVDPELADRLIDRLCSAVIGRAAAGEQLRLTIEQDQRQIRISLTRPAAIRGLTEAQMFGRGEESLGEGFWMRLGRGLARIAGADLTTTGASVSLVFERA